MIRWMTFFDFSTIIVQIRYGRNDAVINNDLRVFNTAYSSNWIVTESRLNISITMNYSSSRKECFLRCACLKYFNFIFDLLRVHHHVEQGKLSTFQNINNLILTFFGLLRLNLKFWPKRLNLLNCCDTLESALEPKNTKNNKKVELTLQLNYEKARN